MPDRIDLGALRLREGYFLKNDTDPRSYTEVVERRDSFWHCYTYRDSPPVLSQELLSLISSAKRKIFVASFLIGDRDVLAALYEAADRLGGGVYVLTALDERSLSRGLRELEEDEGREDDEARFKRFAEMTSRGLMVRAHENCHAKFVVVDDRAALVSSANLVRRGMTLTGENGVVISDRAEVERLGRFFTRLWWGAVWEAMPGESYMLRERKPAPSPFVVPVPTGASAPSVIWTYPGELVIASTIRDVIERARQRLLLATFSLGGLTQQPEVLLDGLEKAARSRDLDVRLLMRARNAMARDRAQAQSLTGIGVKIHADWLTHAKAVIADDQHGALFSANFNVEESLTDGVEVGARLDGQPALASAIRYLEHAIANADLQFVPNPSQRDMDVGLDEKWHSCWTHGETLRVTATARDWETFERAAHDAPVLYEDQPNVGIDLIAGPGRWRLIRKPNGDGYLMQGAGPVVADAASVLSDWWGPSRRTRQSTSRPQRGFCPAVLLRQT